MATRALTFSFTKVRTQSSVVWKDQVGRWVIRIVLIELGIMIGLIGWRFKNLPPEIPLWFSRPWGETQLAQPWMLWLLPALTSLTLVLSTLGGGLIFTTEKLAARIWLLSAGLLGFLTATSTVR